MLSTGLAVPQKKKHTNQMDDISIFRAGDPDEEIVGLDVAIYEGLVMNRLNSGNLMCKREAQNNVRAYQTYKDRPS